MGSNLLRVSVGGVALRAALVALVPALPALLQHRTELLTPLLSWLRLQEGHHLLTRLSPSLNPYSSGSFHGPPLFLFLVGPFTALPDWAGYALWTAADVGIAWALAGVAERRKRGEVLEEEGGRRWGGARVAAMYLFHPFSVGTTLARSGVTFSNLFVALAVESAVSGSTLAAVSLISLATHFSLYPVLLLPPLLLLAHQSSPTSATGEAKNGALASSLRKTAVEGAAFFLFHQASLLFLSRYLTGSWEFLFSAYGVILTIPDLTPNIGLSWYFFIEMFDHFRAFFLCVWALHPVVYVAPLTYYYRENPLFAITLLTGATSLLKSYPSLGDYALWHGLLACFSELLPYVHSPLFLSLLPLHALFLLPTFHYLWLSSGSGNANFFYASTLVWAVGMGGWTVEAMKAFGRREVGRGLGGEGRGKVKSGEWGVVQR
ncbi:hypothetical protein JCM8547_007573 [Rhodosporidiobolus lusitaniae]